MIIILVSSDNFDSQTFRAEGKQTSGFLYMALDGTSTTISIVCLCSVAVLIFVWLWCFPSGCRESGRRRRRNGGGRRRRRRKRRNGEIGEGEWIYEDEGGELGEGECWEYEDEVTEGDYGDYDGGYGGSDRHDGSGHGDGVCGGVWGDGGDSRLVTLVVWPSP